MSLPKPLALLFVALLAVPALADDLHLHDGRVIDGVVVKSESASKVEYRRKSVTQKVDSSEVRNIVYGRTSANFIAGMDALANGDSLAAAGAFIQAAENEDLPDFVRATAYAECGEALLENNNFSDALGIFDELLKSYPDSRHYARALLGKGRAQFFNRQVDDAAATFKKLQDDASARDLGELWGLEAEFALLWADEARGKKGVLEGYKDLRARCRDDYPAVANQCSLRMGRVYLSSDKVDEALPLFNEIIDSRLTTDRSIVAGAFNGRGRCLFWEGQNELAKSREATNKKESERAAQYLEDALASFRAARLDFLRVNMVYLGVAREQPESLYWGGQAFLNVASLDSAEADAERFGKILLKRCSDRFPQSEWGSKAKDEI